MTALERFEGYLAALERRLRWGSAVRGLALTALAAAALTLALVWWTNRAAFAEGSLLAARWVLFVGLGLVLALGLLKPLMAWTRRRAAVEAEKSNPAFEERLLTLEQHREHPNPFHELLAREIEPLAREASPQRIVKPAYLWGSLTAALAGGGALLWMILAAPGWLGHGASLLWAGTPRSGDAAFYRIEVTPGNAKVRKGGDQVVHALTFGFDPQTIRVFARYKSTAKWEPARMEPKLNGPGYEFLFAGLTEPVEYYVEAGNVKSNAYTLNVVEMPSVKKVKVTFRYPSWTGMKETTEDPGGDLRAVEGTEAEVFVETDRPLTNGLLLMDDGTRVPLVSKGGHVTAGKIAIKTDGLYYIAALDEGEPVRLSEDYFIEARVEKPPMISLLRPGRDAKVSPIEEVTVEAEAADDYSLTQFELKYSVNGGPEQTASLLKAPGAKESRSQHTISLEDYKLVPGDVVSLYLTAKDARTTTRSDMYFLEARPYEYEYSQSQQGGGGGGGGMGDGQQNKISERQKEIIAATWNQLRANLPRAQAQQNAEFLSQQQAKLADQAATLAKRMQSRELAQQNAEFKSFAKDMEEAAKQMKAAAGDLQPMKFREALAPEQKALQHLLRAESVFRQIQVAFGRQGGGGGGGGGAGRDLESLFELELDTEKNQYETGRNSQGEQQSASREIDEALKRLEQLARRQQQLAQQNQQQRQQNFQQRWEQEMLRREAEQLKRRMEELAGRQQGSQQQGSQQQSGQQSGQQSAGSTSPQQGRQSSQGSQQGGQQSAGGQSSQQSLRSMAGMGGSNDPRLRRAIEQLERATEDMRRSAQNQSGQQQPGQPQSGQPGSDPASARRAAERLAEAANQLGGMRRQEAGAAVDDLARRSEQLAQQQKEFMDKMKQAYGTGEGTARPSAQGQAKNEELAAEKDRMKRELERLEQDLRNATRELAGSQRQTATKLRDALGEMQQRELKLRMQYGADYIRRGYGAYIQNREQPVQQGLDKLRDQIRDAQQQMAGNGGGQGSNPGQQQGREGMERALAPVERLREQIGQMGQQGGGAGRAGEMPSSVTMEGGPYGSMRRGGFSAMNRGDRQIQPQRSITPQEMEALMRSYGDTQRELARLREQAGGDGELEPEVNRLLKEMQALDPKRFPGNPEMVERLRQSLLPNLERLELQLRRRLDETPGGAVRSGLPDQIPAGYADKVAEYFRKLSRGK